MKAEYLMKAECSKNLGPTPRDPR